LELYLGHLIGDFMLQPGRLVAAKRESPAGVLLHSFIVAVATGAVLWGQLDLYWPVVVLVGGAHIVIEFITIAIYTRTRTRGLFTFTCDQVMHISSLVVLTWLAGGWTDAPVAMVFGFPIGVPLLAAIDGLATVMFLGSILVFETANAWASSDETKGRLLRLDASRVGGWAERGSALGLALAAAPAGWPAIGLLVVPFVPRTVYGLRLSGIERRRQMVIAASGLALCLVAWLFVSGFSAAWFR
jgi:hypothetical protein